MGRIRDITQTVLTLYDSILRHERCLAVELTTATSFSIHIYRTIESRPLSPATIDRRCTVSVTPNQNTYISFDWEIQYWYIVFLTSVKSILKFPSTLSPTAPPPRFLEPLSLKLHPLNLKSVFVLNQSSTVREVFTVSWLMWFRPVNSRLKQQWECEQK